MAFRIGADGELQDGRGFMSTRAIKAGEQLRERYTTRTNLLLVYGFRGNSRDNGDFSQLRFSIDCQLKMVVVTDDTDT